MRLLRGSSRRHPSAPAPVPFPAAPHAPTPHAPTPHPPAARDPGRARDYDGPVSLAYAPRRDGEPDPGEVVWTWVPYEEDASQGKDRPVVVVGRPSRGRTDDLVVLMLTSKDHAGDDRWLVLGPGAWDPEGRVSSVRLDRVLAVSPDAVRREGAALERERFDRVAAALLARVRPSDGPGPRSV